MVIGDLRDPAALLDACAGITSMFLVSSPTQDQVELETNAIEAAEQAGVGADRQGVEHPDPGPRDGLHGNHRAIERRLAASSCAAVILQPSFFTSVIDKQGDVVARGAVVLPTGAGKIAWIDPRDIAAVGAAALVRDDLDGPLHLTGPGRARRRRGRGPARRDSGSTFRSTGGARPWLRPGSTRGSRIRACTSSKPSRAARSAETTDTVERVLGRPPPTRCSTS